MRFSPHIAARLNSLWYGESPWRWLLWPFSISYLAAASARRLLYRRGLLRAENVGAPVIVIGNITVGGTGKTPLVVWLARVLKLRGFQVGIVCRGYLGRAEKWPQLVTPGSDPRLVGDEAVMLAGRTRCPVAAAPDRVAAARALLAESAVDLILSDDGLQHYRLERTLEFAVVDGRRGLGNGLCLPAGPLRESPKRLNEADAVVVNGGDWGHGGVFRVRMMPRYLFELRTGRKLPLAAFKGKRVHAIAGIGHPERFFETLEEHGLLVDPRPLTDHADITEADLQCDGPEPVIMTEKDAVKCRTFAQANVWCLVADLEFEPEDDERFMRLIMRALKLGAR